MVVPPPPGLVWVLIGRVGEHGHALSFGRSVGRGLCGAEQARNDIKYAPWVGVGLDDPDEGEHCVLHPLLPLEVQVVDQVVLLCGGRKWCLF